MIFPLPGGRAGCLQSSDTLDQRGELSMGSGVMGSYQKLNQ